jgi:hypothetical protein
LWSLFGPGLSTFYFNLWDGCAILTIILSTLLITGSTGAADEPTSTVAPSNEQFALANDTDEDITLTASVMPTPNCPGDTTEGPPDYFWDFGPLDGYDWGDGTATIFTDVEGEYQVTVYIMQEFSGANGTYYNETITSTDQD